MALQEHDYLFGKLCIVFDDPMYGIPNMGLPLKVCTCLCAGGYALLKDKFCLIVKDGNGCSGQRSVKAYDEPS